MPKVKSPAAKRRTRWRFSTVRRRKPAKQTPRLVSSTGKMVAAVRGARSAGRKGVGVCNFASDAELVIVMVVVTLPPMGTVGVAFEKVQVALAGRPVHAIATLP